MHEFKLHFWNLPDSTRFILNNNFGKKLFDTAENNDLDSLAKKLDVSYPFVCHLKRGLYSIPRKTLVSLSHLSEIPLREIEKNISLVRTRHGHKSTVKFPIKASNMMASLVGHVYGDGYISAKKRQFEYSNTREELINEVEYLVKKIFKLNPITKKPNRITYSSIVGDVLKCFGATTAPKILNYKKIPEWILYGKKSFKSAFLRSIFDDDGSVMFSKQYNSKGINLHWSIHHSNTKTLLNLLKQIKELLRTFEIFCGKPIISRTYSKKDENRTVMYINITDYSSILNFYNKIGFTSKPKKTKLEKILARGNRYNKIDSINLKNSIIHLLKIKNMSTANLAKTLKFPTQKILKKLIRLETEHCIKKVGKTAPNRSYIWKLTEVTNL